MTRKVFPRGMNSQLSSTFRRKHVLSTDEGPGSRLAGVFLALFSFFSFTFVFQNSLSAQSKPLKEIRVPYALGESTSLFWVAHRSGSFEKHGHRP